MKKMKKHCLKYIFIYININTKRNMDENILSIFSHHIKQTDIFL